MGVHEVRPGAAAAAVAAAAVDSDTVGTVAQRRAGAAGTGSVAAQNRVAQQTVVFVRQTKVGREASKAGMVAGCALEAADGPWSWDWQIAGAEIGADFERRLVSSSSESTLTAGAGPDTGERRQVSLLGESAVGWNGGLGSRQQQALGFEWELNRVNSCPWVGKRLQEDIGFAEPGLQSLEGGDLGLGTGSPRSQCPPRPVCCKVMEGCGQNLRLASAHCWRTAVVEAAAQGEREHRRVSRRMDRSGGMRRESGERRVRATGFEQAMLAPVGCGREKCEVAEQFGRGSRGVGAVDAADVCAVERELELEREAEVCLKLARRGEVARRLRSTLMPDPSCRPVLCAVALYPAIVRRVLFSWLYGRGQRVLRLGEFG